MAYFSISIYPVHPSVTGHITTSTFNNRNGKRARLECCRSWVRATVGSNQTLSIGMCCISAKQAALRGKSKDWLTRNQNNVPEWSDMSIRGLLFQ
jgi:hypothetical protein